MMREQENEGSSYTINTRPIFVDNQRMQCQYGNCYVTDDKCWNCAFNRRKHYDKSKPKYTVECGRWNRELMTEV